MKFDPISWIAASGRIEAVSSKNEQVLIASFARYRPIDHVGAFSEPRLTARKRGQVIRVAKETSLGLKFGCYCSIKLAPLDHGTRIDARIWHGLFLTIWLSLIYFFAATVLIGGSIGFFTAANHPDRFSILIIAPLFAAVLIAMAAVANALARAHAQNSIDELRAALTSAIGR